MHLWRVGPSCKLLYVGGERIHHSHHLAVAIPQVLFQLIMFGVVASCFHDPHLQSILKCNVDIRDQSLVATATAADPTVFRLSFLLCLIDLLTDILKAVQHVTIR